MTLNGKRDGFKLAISSMNIQTRPAWDYDYQWLLELHHTVYRDLITQEFGYWDEDEELGLFVKAWESKPIEILRLDDKNVGMLIVDERADYLWLDEIQIDPRYQHQGIGTESNEGVLDFV